MGKTKLKKIIALSVLTFVFAVVFFTARSSYVSDYLKNLILPELSIAAGRQVTAQRVYINIFPLFVGINDLRMFDKGKELFYLQQAKGYIGFSGILSREVVVKRLVLKRPDVRSNDIQIEDILNKVKAYLSLDRGSPVKFVFKAVIVNDGAFTLDYKDNSFKGKGFSGEAVLGSFTNPSISFSLNDIETTIKGVGELKAEARGSLVIKKDSLDIRQLHVGFNGSAINANGAYTSAPAQGANLQVQANLLARSFTNLFKIRDKDEGNLTAKGTLEFIRSVSGDTLSPVADLELKGNFYIQTLMALLRVQEKIEGPVSVDGRLRGPVNKLAGEAKIRLKNGNLFGVAVDDLNTDAIYKDGIFTLKDARGSLYKGRAEAEASFAIPWADYYSVKVRFSDIDSPAVLDLINWRPDIPIGRVSGELNTSGSRFNPTVNFSYKSTSQGRDFLGRIKGIKGSFSLADRIVTLLDTDINTDRTIVNAKGKIDLAASELSLNVFLRSRDLTDISLPYLKELGGAGDFSGAVTGNFENPDIKGTASLQGLSYEGYLWGDIKATLDYEKHNLEVKALSAVAYAQSAQPAITTAEGNVRFKNAEKIFDFRNPVYSLKVSMKNADLESFTRYLYREPLKIGLGGRLNSDFTIAGAGPAPQYKGFAQIDNFSVDKIKLDSAAFSFLSTQAASLFRNIAIRKNKSLISLAAGISKDGHFDFKTSGGRVFLKDITEVVPPDIMFSGHTAKDLSSEGFIDIKAEGSGLMDNPQIELEGNIHNGSLNSVNIGEGKLKAYLADRSLRIGAAIFNEKITVSGKAYLKDDVPWTMSVDVMPGRYDSIIGAFLKDVPEDLLLDIKAHADMSGDRHHFAASAAVSQLNLTLYGYSFANRADIRFNVRDKSLSISPFTLSSGNTSFKVSGNIDIGREYDLGIEGGLALAPLKGIFRRVDTIRGDAAFVFAVTGKWDTPKVNGGIEISNGLIGLKDMPYRLSSINGYFYVDENRVVIERFSGKLGGGDMDASGIAYLQRFKLKRFYIDALLKDVSINMSKDFSANVNGKMLYKGTPDSQMLSGEVKINRARYRERVEWKSWLLKARAAEKPRAETGMFDKAALNIKINGSDNILVDNNIARTALKVDLLLRGTVSRPVLMGRLEAKTGSVYFRNNEFRILNINADFSDPRRTNPVLGILAETSIKGYKIRMNLEGQLDHFNLSLTSEPPLEEMDIFSLLTVGRLGKEVKGIESGIGAGEASSFLTGKMQDVLEERVSSLIGFDRLEVDPYVSKTTGTVSPMVTVSKRLMGDKLFVTYSSAVGSTENNILKLEYLMGKKISIVGIRDEKGGVGGDIKFRFEFR